VFNEDLGAAPSSNPSVSAVGGPQLKLIPKFDNFRRHAMRGARKVLTECLDLKANDVLALFWDETTADTAQLFLHEARKLGLTVRQRYITTMDQANFGSATGLGLEDQEALDNARGIITCLSNHVPGTAYRTELLRVGTDGGKRFGHMPGADVSVLAHAVNIDYVRASSRCDDLALALTLGEEVRLQTYVFDTDGSRKQRFDLNFQVGGLRRSPITSTGIIPLGTWGNLPGGETFIAPLEDTASGVFVLNGAFKNHVIEPPGHLLLHFERGRLVKVAGTIREEVAFNKILDFARSHGDAYYNSLAELGIGVNPGIKQLTGNALFDEKCHGTAHIAIGDSSRYGGQYSSRIHEDLISRAPSLWIDDKPILDAGEDAFSAAQWRERLEDWTNDDQTMNAGSMVTRTTITAEKGPVGKLRVRRKVAAGRVCIYTIGEASTSRILALVYSSIPHLPRQIKNEDLYQTCKRDLALAENQITAAVKILLRHGVISVRTNANGNVHHD
jgi:hypothetical protein